MRRSMVLGLAVVGALISFVLIGLGYVVGAIVVPLATGFRQGREEYEGIVDALLEVARTKTRKIGRDI